MCSLRAARRPQPAVPSAYAQNYERIPAAAGCARRLAVQALEAWDLRHLTDTATLVLTELVTNAVRHAAGDGVRVNVMRVAEGRVHVSVLDRDTTRPRMQDPDPEQEGGRGLRIVEAASVSWGVEVLPGGKRIWAEVAA